MILSNEKIIFIHIPKTGGVSIEDYLLNYFNYKRNELLLIHGFGTDINKPKTGISVYPHMHYTLERVLKIAECNNIKVDNTWTIFSIVRNPYYKFISDLYFSGDTPFKYHYHTIPKNERKYFTNYCLDIYLKSDNLENYNSNHSRPQYQFFENVDLNYKIFKFEDGLPKAISSIGLNVFDMPHKMNINKNFLIPKFNYEEILTKNIVEHINKTYKKDFETFDYTILDPLIFE